ncbi:MAG: hypothetical protein L3J83_04395 [Proteobacteria bacterium]|nr:hypothetical protein [Pseudomonadota bacterium]
MSNEGRKRTGATVAHVIMWGPIGLFAKGRAARVMLNTEFDIEVRTDVNINAGNPIIEKTVERENFEVFFSKYSKKINFAKGKIGKDFKLNIKLPQATQLNRKSIQITKSLGHNLPKPISPKLLSWDSKKNVFVAVFSFKDMVKYIAPGISNVTIEANTQSTNFIGETTIQTKWKMK